MHHQLSDLNETVTDPLLNKEILQEKKEFIRIILFKQENFTIWNS